MTFAPSFGFLGVAASIRELSQIDPELAKAAKARMKEAASPMVNTVRGFIPTDSPLSGMKRANRLGWSTARARSGVTAKVATKANRDGTIPLLRIVQNNAAASMWDMAGKASPGTTPAGRNMVKVMTERNGAPSRSMWKAADRMRAITEQNLRIAVTDLEAIMDNRLGRD